MLSNLDRHQNALNEYMDRQLFMFCLVSKALSQISCSFYLITTIEKGVGNYIVYNKDYVYKLCLQTIKRNELAPQSDAFLGQRLLSLTLHGRSTALNCAITTVQYQPYNTVGYCTVTW